MKSRLLVVVAALMIAGEFSSAADSVEPALVGTWKLQWQGSDILWAIRPDGVYRIHGLGANPRQLGKLEAANGTFSMKSMTWVDSGSYKVSDDTLLITGKLGPGTWKRVWTASSRPASRPQGAGSCGLVSDEEVAQLLRAPVSGGSNPDAAGRCVFKSALNSADQVAVSVFPARREAFFLTRRGQGNIVPVSGVGEDAYAELQSDQLVLHIIKGAAQASIRLSLTPGATLDDLPYLAELGRAAGNRLGGTGR